VKRLLWIIAVPVIAFIIGACSNATDSVRAVEEVEETLDGLNLATLSSLEDILSSRRENISVKLGLAGASSYSIKSGGNLPNGLSMDSDGLITGTASEVASDTTASFTVVADTGVETPLTWTVKALQTKVFTGGTNWTAPEAGYSTNNQITLQVLMVGGGGGGGASMSDVRGGGGGGGQVKEQAVQVTPGETIPITVGGKGSAGSGGGNPGGLGGTTSFGSYLSALGGGGGSGASGEPTPPGDRHPGGSATLSSGGDGTGAGGVIGSRNGKRSIKTYNGSTIWMGGGGAGGRYIMSFAGVDGGGGIDNRAPMEGTANTGGGGAGGPVGYAAAGGTGVVYVNY